MSKTRKSLTESLKEVLAKPADQVEVATSETEQEVSPEATVEEEVEQIDELWKATEHEGKHVLKHKSGKVSSKSYSSKEEAIQAAVRKNKVSGAFKEEAEVDELDETTAGDSLHPGAAPGMPMSKIEMMSKAIGAMSVMSPNDLTSWFTKAIENSKHYSSAPVGNAASNQATLDMKPSNATTNTAPKTKDPMPKLACKEDVEAALAGFELTEETQDKLTTLFEAAVTARVILENERLQEEFEAKLDEEIANISEALADQVDNYLTYVVEHFMQENEVAIESSLRNELMSGLIDGMKDLFKEHNVDFPESKVDVVEALTDKVTELEAAFDETIQENAALKADLLEVERERVVDGLLEGLVLSEADKFLKLVEGVDFDGDLETYAKKLTVVKENYFKSKSTPAKTNIIEESFEGDTQTSTDVKMDPAIARYLESINRTLKS